MRYTTINFDVCRGSASYTCPCRVCGKTLNRKAVEEKTVNPFNKNEDGSEKSRAQVTHDAYRAAEAAALKLQDVPDICQWCEEAPVRDLLLEMAADPDLTWPSAQVYGSPMRTLYDRKQVDYAHVECACGSDCCSGYKRDPGFKITKKGLERAGTLRAEIAKREAKAA